MQAVESTTLFRYNSAMSKPAFTLVETLTIGSLFGLVLVVGTVVFNVERSRTRDAKRIADMTMLASGFALLYAEQASYEPAAAGCSKVGDPAASCAVIPALGETEALKDPGRFTYKVSRVPDKEDFGISFRLERRYGGLAAGPHTLSKSGIK